MRTPKITLKPKREESLLRYHPWIFSGAIAHIDGNPQEGDMVRVYSAQGEQIASGHYQQGSISVRILSFGNEEAGDELWLNRIRQAYRLRLLLELAGNSKENTAYRLVHGEGDFLPGLVIDIYGTTAVVQAHSVGMYRNLDRITDALKQVYGNQLNAVYSKSSATIPFKGLNVTDEYLYGQEKNPATIIEYGNKFNVSWVDGQKTGFFLDQRENRMLLERYCKDAKVLNTFCYTGGFSVYALKGGAKLVHSVDSSKKAVELTDENIALNFGETNRHQSFVSDTLKFLRSTQEQYNIVVVDPPAFAKHQSALRNALQAYKRLNVAALQHIEKGGLLFTFSCSQAVSKEAFQNAIFSAAAISQRKVRIIHRLSQPADHPVSIYHPEGEYLKGLVLYVE